MHKKPTTTTTTITTTKTKTKSVVVGSETMPTLGSCLQMQYSWAEAIVAPTISCMLAIKGAKVKTHITQTSC